MRKRRYFLMAPLALVLGITLFSTPIKAVVGSWSSNGSVIYYNDGSVSLGSNSSSGKLQVVSNNAWNNGGGIRLQSAASGNYTLLYQSTDSSAQKSTIQSFQMGTGVGVRPLLLNPQGGNTGVGTTNPQGKFQITSNNPYYEGGGFRLQSSDTANYTLLYGSTDGSAQTSTIQSFQVGSGVGSRSLLLNPQGGKVGIGTTNPSATLSVNGTIKAKEVQVTTSGWADYVFGKDYDLMSLDELSNYISTNKHLPNLPSADEVEADGLSLGEMQNKQMEKIEELTLYLIQQNNEIKELKAEIQALK